MQKVLFRVYGRPASGKTTAINLAFDKFKERHPNATCVLPYENDGHGDILVAVEVKGISVGFSSIGDDVAQIKENLQKLREKNCDIIVCATRTHGGTKDAVMEFNDEYHIESYQSQRDNNVATVIVEFIDDYIADNS